MSKCCHCHRSLSLLEVTYEVPREDGGADEWCEECDAGLPEQLRPSLDYVPSLLRSVERGDRGPREPFCTGVSGRSQCDDCAGRYVVDEGFATPPRILAHQPWPFEPCPHYRSE